MVDGCSRIFLNPQVAGGLASGQSIMDCARKECQEEASVPENLIQQLKPVGCVRSEEKLPNHGGQIESKLLMCYYLSG